MIQRVSEDFLDIPCLVHDHVSALLQMNLKKILRLMHSEIMQTLLTKKFEHH